jgi:hypothetical protein
MVYNAYNIYSDNRKTTIYKNVDLQIRAAIIELNKAGMITLDSCAGHALPKDKPEIYWVKPANGKSHNKLFIGGLGSISFNPNGYKKEVALNIMRKHKLNILVQITYKYGKDKVIGVLFKSVGKPDKEWAGVAWEFDKTEVPYIESWLQSLPPLQ